MTSHQDTIYESTLFSLTCSAVVPDSVDTSVSVNFVWFDPQGQAINDSNDDRLYFQNGVNNQTLFFDPIDNGDNSLMMTNDSGRYTCQVTISPSVDGNIQSIMASVNSAELIVEGKITFICTFVTFTCYYNEICHYIKVTIKRHLSL